MGVMRSPRTLLFPLVAALFAACETANYTADLAENDVFYTDVPYTTKSPGDRSVHVLPVADRRDGTKLPAHERGFPITYAGDDFWERPVTVMIADVLARQLRDSRLFPTQVDTVEPGAVLVKPTLLAFTTAAIEGMAGSRSFAEVGLQLQIYGPVNTSGKRPLWHDRVYSNRQATQLELHPISPYRLVGRALQIAVGKALVDLDGSNVARTAVPTERTDDIEIAVEASAPVR